ncbi:MAG: thermonuclease family protein [Oscillatoriales cyanobacterium SM2_2_1]|nr:thermonuclease family protein [Oscillatoriales cyanobacterium SM2_2_1]
MPAAIRRRIFFALVLLVVLAAANLGIRAMGRSPAPAGEGWVISKVINGATLSAAPANNLLQPEKRLILEGLRAPLRDQRPWGEAAARRLEELVGIKDKERKILTVETDLTVRDDRDRLLVYLWDGDRLINELLLREGLVTANFQTANTKYQDRFRRAQAEARILERGVWNPREPLREFMRRRRP